MIMNGIATSDVATMLAVTVLVGLFAVAVNNLLLALERRVAA